MLPHFEKKFPGDDRPRKAIAAARAYVAGEISREELRYASFAAADAYDAADDSGDDAYAYASSAAYFAATCAYVAADEEAAASAADASSAAYVERKKQAAWFVEIFTQ